MDLIGREHPAGLLRTAVDRALASHGGLVLVGGEPGIGKTTLVTAAADEARGRGALVLGAACWASGSAPGYWPWVQVVRGLRRAPDDWVLAREAAEPGLRRLLGEAPTTEPRGIDDEGVDTADEGDSDEEAFALHDAVTTALVAVSQRRPVVVLLDDLHWADPASMRLLRFAAQHTWFERLLFIGTYRDAEVESADHPLRPLLLPLTAKATTITLDGLSRDEVGALITRTAGREPDPELLDEVHRRTGGNPFFVEQTARLWRADGAAGAIAPGVREAVRQRLAQLPAAVVEALTVAAVLGREFHRQVLADCVPSPAAETDRLLGRAVTARLVVSRGGGRFAFVHDLVRETLYDGLSDDDRRARHAAVVRAADRSAELAERLLPGELAGHAWLAGPGVDPAHATDLLLLAARGAARRLASDEAVMHFRRALDVVADPAQRAKTMVELGRTLQHHHGDRAGAERLMADAAAIVLDLDDPVVLARVAITVYRHRHSSGSAADPDGLLREAHRRLIGEPASAATPGALVTDLITATETLARKGQDDEALTFTLWARHDTTWGLGTAADRAALTAEIRDVARRTGDVETELWATSLRWVALLELGDPGYYRELTAMATLGRAEDLAAYRMMVAIDVGVVAGFRGDFAEADACYTELESFGEWTDGEHAFMTPHLRWAWLLPQGRFAEIDALLDRPDPADRDYVELLRAITAAERGDAGTAARLTAALEAAGVRYGRAVSPLWHRLRAEVAAASGDAGRCAEVREVLRPYRGQWLVALFGCDVSGPVDHWLARLDLAERRWDDAVAGFRAAGEAADRMGSRHWSLLARAGLVEALSGGGQAQEAATLRATVAEQARALGMPRVAERFGAQTAAPVDEPRPAGHEFRFDGAVWRLAYAGTVVHLPDAKGLHDLRLLLSRPGVDVPVAELLDPSAGPELVAARRLGGDPVLDDEAKARYRHHLDLLDEQIDRAALQGDEPRLAALDAERAALLEQLRAAAGLAGRTRRLGDEAERARKTVTARIRDTLRRLDERHPALAAHLRETVSTGSACSYRPPSPPPWRF
ncbi:AAA family ATPase [Dactylosporangium sp. AC04546]|uniref:ATP-binding protein n=1 Tax=Dactylosporangium sp. AC04546 TaxID=2862460 RepID=UPI001EDE0CD0|nr:AAA family ATPase [Dactylosporangium sp. AC04546]WVK88836.1 AAA family ATPase [Dactylosporangium sp. AC04546]